MQFKIADLQRDADLLDKVQELALEVNTNLPLAASITERWLSSNERYGQV